MTAERSSTPLEQIRQNEREWFRRLEAARAEADEQRRRAQSQAKERLAQAYQQAAAEAQSMLEQAIADAEQEAMVIRQQAQTAAADLRAHRRARITAIAEIVVEWVLPDDTAAAQSAAPDQPSQETAQTPRDVLCPASPFGMR